MEEVNPQMLLGRLAPLFLFLIVTMFFSAASSSFGSQEHKYAFSFQPSYNYPEKLQTFRMQQVYYVSPYTMRDFRTDREGKLKR